MMKLWARELQWLTTFWLLAGAVGTFALCLWDGANFLQGAFWAVVAFGWASIACYFNQLAEEERRR